MKLRAELIDGLLAEYGPPTAWHSRASQRPCQGTKFHSPVPFTTSRFDDPALDDVWLCPTCASKLEVFLHLYDADPASLNWDVLREFGNQIRLYGQKIITDRERDSA
jgi:hypothetical protein